MKRQSSLGKLTAVVLQSVGVQLLGLTFFYLLSTRLSTAAFGLLSWANAVSVLLTTIISAGLEQVVLRRVAAGNRTSAWAATAFLLHSAAGSVVMLAILTVVRLCAGNGHEGISLLPLLFAVQAIALLVVPFRLLLNARAHYAPYAIIAFCANAARIATALVYIRLGYSLGISSAAALLLIFTVAELIATALYVAASKTPLPLRVPLRGYKRLLREASPQYLSVIFDISLARVDWILMGMLSTDANTGLYTFAYRAFELLRMPTVAVSLLLMPRIAPLLQRSDRLDAGQQSSMRHFFRLEMWAASGLALLLNVVWIPLAGHLTHNRYGASNATEVAVLSLCLPLHFAINLMWILAFSARKYAAIARITMLTSLVNLAANALLIPLLGGRGAAIAFLAASSLQATLYFLQLRKIDMPVYSQPMFACLCTAGACSLLYYFLPLSVTPAIAVTLVAYIGLTAVLRQWRTADAGFLKQMLAA